MLFFPIPSSLPLIYGPTRLLAFVIDLLMRLRARRKQTKKRNDASVEGEKKKNRPSFALVLAC